MGVTDVYEDGKLRYWSSGEEFDSNGAAWINGSLDGANDNDCAAVYNGDRLGGYPCGSSFYGLCELDADIC